MYGVSAPGANQRKPIDNALLDPDYSRNGKTVRRFSSQEDVLIEKTRERGETIAAISRATKRRHNSITGRLASLARHKEIESSAAAPLSNTSKR